MGNNIEAPPKTKRRKNSKAFVVSKDAVVNLIPVYEYGPEAEARAQELIDLVAEMYLLGLPKKRRPKKKPL